MSTTWNWLNADGEVCVTAESPEGRAKALAHAVPFMTKSHGPLREVEIVRDNALSKVLAGQLNDLRAAVRELVEALPECDLCEQPATRAWRRGEERYCDIHGTDWCGLAGPEDIPEYPRAAPLRKVLALLGEP